MRHVVDPDWLAIYLNDHLGGATAGVELARRLARSGDPTLIRVADAIAEDRRELVAMMKELGVPIRRYKQVAGRVAERLGRLKLNGRLLRRSPLSALVELEMLHLGIEGKAALWRTLQESSRMRGTPDAERLAGLEDRAERQSSDVETFRVRAAALVVRGSRVA